MKDFYILKYENNSLFSYQIVSIMENKGKNRMNPQPEDLKIGHFQQTRLTDLFTETTRQFRRSDEGLSYGAHIRDTQTVFAM